MQIICICQKYFVILHRFFGSEPKTNPKSNPKNNETMNAKKKIAVVQKLMRGGFNANDAQEMTIKFWDLAERIGCKTVREIADAVSWFWAAE